MEKYIQDVEPFPGVRFETVIGLPEVRHAVRSSSTVFSSYGRPNRLEPISNLMWAVARRALTTVYGRRIEEIARSEEHTSELQSSFDLVCRLLLEKKNTSEQKP